MSGAWRPELDGLRGVAILMVIIAHALPFYGVHVRGWPGVQLFFVLSGYLITGLLLTEHAATGRIDLRRFYERRVRRLAPALVAVLVVLAVGGAASGEAIAATTFYVANWARVAGMDMGTLDHAWSLAIEEQFYIVWPLLAGFLVRPRATAAVAVVVVIAVVMRWSVSPLAGVYSTLPRADGLLVGALLAMAQHRGVALPRRGGTLAAVGLVGIVVLGLEPPQQAAWGITVATVLSAVMVATARPGWLSARPLVWLGGVSYGLYLWHWPIYMLAMPTFGALVVIPASVVMAGVSARVIELPFRKARGPGMGADLGFRWIPR